MMRAAFVMVMVLLMVLEIVMVMLKIVQATVVVAQLKMNAVNVVVMDHHVHQIQLKYSIQVLKIFMVFSLM